MNIIDYLKYLTTTISEIRDFQYIQKTKLSYLINILCLILGYLLGVGTLILLAYLKI
jgi:hypothetical protein